MENGRRDRFDVFSGWKLTLLKPPLKPLKSVESPKTKSASTFGVRRLADVEAAARRVAFGVRERERNGRFSAILSLLINIRD